MDCVCSLILLCISLVSCIFFSFFPDNYGSLKEDGVDGHQEAERVIIINKPQTHQYCNNKIRWKLLKCIIKHTRRTQF